MTRMHFGGNVESLADRVTDAVLSVTMVVLLLAGWAAYAGLDKDALFIGAVKIVLPLAAGYFAGRYNALRDRRGDQ